MRTYFIVFMIMIIMIIVVVVSAISISHVNLLTSPKKHGPS
jgi:hypothetical protein